MLPAEEALNIGQTSVFTYHGSVEYQSWLIVVGSNVLWLQQALACITR